MAKTIKTLVFQDSEEKIKRILDKLNREEINPISFVKPSEARRVIENGSFKLAIITTDSNYVPDKKYGLTVARTFARANPSAYIIGTSDKKEDSQIWASLGYGFALLDSKSSQLNNLISKYFPKQDDIPKEPFPDLTKDLNSNF